MFYEFKSPSGVKYSLEQVCCTIAIDECRIKENGFHYINYSSDTEENTFYIAQMLVYDDQLYAMHGIDDPVPVLEYMLHCDEFDVDAINTALKM